MAAKWVYIAGRGHSGSTVMDALLGNADKVESVGELISGIDRYDVLCSCHEKFKDCPFWTKVRSQFEAESGMTWDSLARTLKSSGHVKKFPKTLMASANSGWVSKVKHANDYLCAAIAGENEVVLDSSKEITRALFLIKHSSNARVIHLVRNPRDILASNYWRMKRGDGFKLLRYHFKSPRFFGLFLFISTINWLIGNMLSAFVRVANRKRFIRIRYEDLIDHTEDTLTRLGDFMEVPMEGLIARVKEREELSMGHNIGGNRMRLKGNFVLNTKRSTRDLPKFYAVMTWLMTWPMLWYFGYFSKRKSD